MDFLTPLQYELSPFVGLFWIALIVAVYSFFIIAYFKNLNDLNTAIIGLVSLIILFMFSQYWYMYIVLLFISFIIEKVYSTKKISKITDIIDYVLLFVLCLEVCFKIGHSIV